MVAHSMENLCRRVFSFRLCVVLVGSYWRQQQRRNGRSLYLVFGHQCARPTCTVLSSLIRNERPAQEPLKLDESESIAVGGSGGASADALDCEALHVDDLCFTCCLGW